MVRQDFQIVTTLDAPYWQLFEEYKARINEPVTFRALRKLVCDYLDKMPKMQKEESLDEPKIRYIVR